MTSLEEIEERTGHRDCDVIITTANGHSFSACRTCASHEGTE